MKGEPIDLYDPNLSEEPLDIDPTATLWPPSHMPFGKYRGWRISELPDRYLFWVAKNLDLDDLLREAIDAELARRRPKTPPLSCEFAEEPRAGATAGEQIETCLNLLSGGQG